MDKEYYFNHLYPLQDKILRVINTLETGFYLTGGTASSRAYLHHRFSEDLDFFVNDDHRFLIWAERIIHTLTQQGDLEINILQREERFSSSVDRKAGVRTIFNRSAKTGGVTHYIKRYSLF